MARRLATPAARPQSPTRASATAGPAGGKSFNDSGPGLRLVFVVNRLPPSRPAESAAAVLPAGAAGLARPGRSLFRHPLALETETCWLLLLGVLDLILTTVLLNTGRVQEANPVARAFLFAGGLNGLIGYKCALLAVATVTAQVIALRRLQAARLVLFVGIAAHFLVVGYSVALLLKVV